ncbi:MAG TPA: hemerythrin domain-containing protein [Mycobacteriales bacterium]|nr:hemerythrin domain-containing protein [Mycobacteriales bacterium]
MSISVRTTDDLLTAAVAEPHDRAVEALEDRWPDAVVWCSAHLSAVDRVLYPALQRHVPGGRREVRRVRAVDHRLQQAVCRLDRRLTGATHLAPIPLPVLGDQVRAALLDHAEAERVLLQALQAILDQQRQEELVHRLADAMTTAPTRPHPHTPHTPLAAVTGWLDAVADRARDVMDNRVDPTGRPGRAVSPCGRWGCYLMGIPYPQDRPAARRAS